MSLVAFGALAGAAVYGPGGAAACALFGLASAPGLMLFAGLGVWLGGAMSRVLAASAGATLSILLVYRLGDAEPWESRLAFVVGGLAGLVAASAYREYLARRHGCPRFKVTMRGLLLRTVYVTIAAFSLANHWSAADGQDSDELPLSPLGFFELFVEQAG